MTLDREAMRAWVGRREEREDLAGPWPVAALAALLDRDDEWPAEGDLLPPGAHWLYFLSVDRQSNLGADGHATRGGFMPPVPLPRRMWAGGAITFHAPIRIGDPIRRISTIEDVTFKEGRSGLLVFVPVRHRVTTPRGLAIEERHDIVYRATADAKAAPPPPPSLPPAQAAVWHRQVRPDPVLLFRYSALTFNGHRIHYDRPHATETEGYPGLVVHGPLMATLLLDLCRRQAPGRTLAGFDYRVLAPLFDGVPLALNGRPSEGGADLWTAGPDGAPAMTATATFVD